MPTYRMVPEFERPASGFRILTLFGVPVFVELSFLFFMLIIFMLNSGAEMEDPVAAGLFCFIVFFSLLVHELGHALTARALGCRDIRIALVMFGGYATHSATTRGKSLLIVLAGPAAGFLLMGLAYYLMHFPAVVNLGGQGAMRFILPLAFELNRFWSIFNLIPVHPMDGGQTLFHGLTFGLDPHRAMRIVLQVSMVLCVVLGVLALQMNIGRMIPLFFAMFFFQNMQMLQSMR